MLITNEIVYFDSDIMRQLMQESKHKYTNDETLCLMTLIIEEHLPMVQILDLCDAGYMDTQSKRDLINLWIKRDGYAGLTLQEFLNSVNSLPP